MNRCKTIYAFATLLCVPLAACGEEAAVEEVTVDLTTDPLLARALNDPLMVDPDLSWRNEANAVIAFRDGHPLPPFQASENSQARAEEAARIELLENGQLFDLPAFSVGEGTASLSEVTNAGAMVESVGARTDCIENLTGDLDWSTAMPPTSSIMPHGMIQQAAGVDEGTCVIRVVRYVTPASAREALRYHFTKVDRARFRIEVFEEPELQMIAERRDQKLAVHLREGEGGMTHVDVIHWRK